MIKIQLRQALQQYHERTGTRMTYQELADSIEVSKATVESIASRAEYNTSLDTVDRICTVLGCDLHDLLEYCPEEE